MAIGTDPARPGGGTTVRPATLAYGKDLALDGLEKIAGGKRAVIEEMIELTQGENKIDVTCLNRDGTESLRAVTHARCDEQVSRDLYFLGFGVSRYMNSVLDLKYAAKDVEDLARAFASMRGGLFKNVFA